MSSLACFVSRSICLIVRWASWKISRFSFIMISSYARSLGGRVSTFQDSSTPRTYVRQYSNSIRLSETSVICGIFEICVIVAAKHENEHGKVGLLASRRFLSARVIKPSLVSRFLKVFHPASSS